MLDLYVTYLSVTIITLEFSELIYIFWIYLYIYFYQWDL